MKGRVRELKYFLGFVFQQLYNIKNIHEFSLMQYITWKM